MRHIMNKWKPCLLYDHMTKGGFFTKFHDVIKKISGSLGFFIKKRNDVSKKELFFIHFHTRPTIDEIPEKE